MWAYQSLSERTIHLILSLATENQRIILPLSPRYIQQPPKAKTNILKIIAFSERPPPTLNPLQIPHPTKPTPHLNLPINPNPIKYVTPSPNRRLRLINRLHKPTAAHPTGTLTHGKAIYGYDRTCSIGVAGKDSEAEG